MVINGKRVRLLKRFFGFKWLGQTNPSRLLINILKYFWFLFRIRRDIRLFVNSAYSQYTYRFILRILRIRTDSFHIFSVYEQIHSTYSQYTKSKISSNNYLILRILRIRTDTNSFILRILSIRTDSFPVFGECGQIIFNVWNWIVFITAFKGILLQKKVCMCASGPKSYIEWSIIWP